MTFKNRVIQKVILEKDNKIILQVRKYSMVILMHVICYFSMSTSYFPIKDFERERSVL